MTEKRSGSSEWALITVTFNSAAELRCHWADARIGNAEWIVVDNASSDDSVLIARKLGARVIPLQRNVGFGAANNVGLAQATRKWTAFVNPDLTIGHADDLERLAETSSRHGAIVAPQLLNPDGSEQPNGRGIPFLVDKMAHRSLRLPGSDARAYSRTELQVPTYVCWVIGAAVTGPTALFRSIGGWDERYFVYYEDHDLGIRAWSAGIPVIVDPLVRWTHRWQRSTTRLAVTPWSHELRAGTTFYRTHPPMLSRARFRKASSSRPWMIDLQSRLWTPAQADHGGLGEGSRRSPVIVVPIYRPDGEVLENLEAMSRQAPVVAVDDGSPLAYEPTLEQVAKMPEVRLVRSEGNRGIAAALNRGIAVARSDEPTVIFCFDQDSSPDPNHVSKLVQRLDADVSGEIGIIGPGITDGTPRTRTITSCDVPQQVRTLIQSGMAIRVETLDRVGEFDESLFIDGVDTDYCLRVRKTGFRVVADPTLAMGHRLGAGPGVSRRFKVGPFTPVASGHEPFRRYYINRNAVRLIRRHAVFDPRWALLEIRHILVGNFLACSVERRRLRKMKAIAWGVAHGIVGRGGAWRGDAT